MTISNCIIIMLYAFPDGDILLQADEYACYKVYNGEENHETSGCCYRYTTCIIIYFNVMQEYLGLCTKAPEMLFLIRRLVQLLSTVLLPSTSPHMCIHGAAGIKLWDVTRPYFGWLSQGYIDVMLHII